MSMIGSAPSSTRPSSTASTRRIGPTPAPAPFARVSFPAARSIHRSLSTADGRGRQPRRRPLRSRQGWPARHHLETAGARLPMRRCHQARSRLQRAPRPRSKSPAARRSSSSFEPDPQPRPTCAPDWRPLRTLHRRLLRGRPVRRGAPQATHRPVPGLGLRPPALEDRSLRPVAVRATGCARTERHMPQAPKPSVRAAAASRSWHRRLDALAKPRNQRGKRGRSRVARKCGGPYVAGSARP